MITIFCLYFDWFDCLSSGLHFGYEDMDRHFFISISRYIHIYTYIYIHIYIYVYIYLVCYT